MACPELRAFDMADLSNVMQAFHGAPASALRQSWLARPEADFAPAKVWTGRREQALLVFAELNDADIFTSATRPNERLWELGDTFEIFLRPANQPAYSELQIAPNNQRLQLRFANTDALEQARRSNSLDTALVHNITFNSWIWVRPEISRWYALAEIPAATICDASSPLRDSVWHFSFCRYDYTHGRSEPVISSTSTLSRPDFHRLSEWRTMQFI